MKVVGGRVVAWLPRDLSIFKLEPVPLVLSAWINLPLLGAAAVVLVLAALLWPVTALVRRRYRVTLNQAPRDARTSRLSRFAALTGVLFLLGWIVLGLAISSGALSFDLRLDPWIRVIQVLGLVAIAGAGVAAWSMATAWTGKQSWWIKVGRTLVALAMLDLVWFSLAFNLISLRLNY
jgi:hypothetical protein